MDKWNLVRNIQRAVRSDDDRLDEHNLRRGLERPRRDNRNPTEPRPGRPTYGPSHFTSDPGPQGGYQSGHLSSHPQGSSPPPPHGYNQNHYNTEFSAPSYTAPHPSSAFPAQSNTYPSGYGNNQGYYGPQAQSYSSYDAAYQTNTAYQGYPSQQASSNGQYQQNAPGFPGYQHSQYPHPHQAGPSSYGPDWYSQTAYPPQITHSASFPRPSGPGNPQDQSYGGVYLANTATAPAASVCEHGRLDDGSCVTFLTICYKANRLIVVKNVMKERDRGVHFAKKNNLRPLYTTLSWNPNK